MTEQFKPDQSAERERYDLDLLRKRIKESPEKMAAERARTGQNFLPCFISRIQAVIGVLEMGKLYGTIEATRAYLIQTRLDQLTVRIREVQRAHPSGGELTDELKAELMAQLNTLMVGLPET